MLWYLYIRYFFINDINLNKYLDVDECEEKIHLCGYGAECINKPGSHECVCPTEYSGDPYRGCSRSQKKCIKDSDCLINENCIQPGVCVCPVPFYTDVLDNNLCKSTHFNFFIFCLSNIFLITLNKI